ncbi:hypothetical protein GCM10017687_45890 [Streptomyces echinatus]
MSVSARSRIRGAHTALPGGAHGCFSAAVTRSVSQASPPSAGSGNPSGTAAVSPGRRSGSSAGAVRIRPSARAGSQAAASQARPRTRWWLATTIPSCRWQRMPTAGVVRRRWFRSGPGAGLPSLTPRTIPWRREPRMKPL